MKCIRWLQAFLEHSLFKNLLWFGLDLHSANIHAKSHADKTVIRMEVLGEVIQDRHISNLVHMRTEDEIDGVLRQSIRPLPSPPSLDGLLEEVLAT